LQVEQLLEKINTKVPHGLRDRAMIELLYASGLRTSELANARLENFNFEERIMRVTGKGTRPEIVPMGRKSVRSARRLLVHGTPEVRKAQQQAARFSFPSAARN